jgi:hypothetical protein
LLGTELRQASREVIQQVIRANAARERLPQLLKLRDDLNEVLASYLGHVKLADSFRLHQGLLRDFPFLGEYFGTDLARGTLRRKDTAPPGLHGVAWQYRHFRRCFPRDVLFLEVGRFVEFYRLGDVFVATELELQSMARNRRGVRYGFPLAHSGSHLLRLLAKGCSDTLRRDRALSGRGQGAGAALQVREPGVIHRASSSPHMAAARKPALLDAFKARISLAPPKPLKC